MHANLNERLYLIRLIEQARGAPLLTYFLHDSALIAEDAILPLHDKLAALGPQPRLDVFLYSRGGFTEITWKVVSLLREFCDHLGLLIPHRAHSGATLIALAADEIVMGPISELSATDPARGHYLLPKGPDGKPASVSVEDLRRVIEWVQMTTDNASQVLPVLFQYVHPLAIGALEQSHELVRRIARKALLTHWDPVEHAEQIDRIVITLNGGLHSSAYPISRKEARDELGLPVVYADPELWSRMWQLYGAYQQAIYYEEQVAGHPNTIQRWLCIIETAARSTGLRQTVLREGMQERILEARWETFTRD